MKNVLVLIENINALEYAHYYADTTVLYHHAVYAALPEHHAHEKLNNFNQCFLLEDDARAKGISLIQLTGVSVISYEVLTRLIIQTQGLVTL